MALDNRINTGSSAFCQWAGHTTTGNEKDEIAAMIHFNSWYMAAGAIVVNNNDVYNTRITRPPMIMNGSHGDYVIIYNAYFGNYEYAKYVGQRWLFITWG